MKSNWLKLRLLKYFGIASLHVARSYSPKIFALTEMNCRGQKLLSYHGAKVVHSHGAEVLSGEPETSGVLELTVANLLVSRSSHFSRKGNGKIFRTIPKCQLCLMVLSYNEPNPILMLGYVNKVTYPPTSLN